MRSKQTGVSLSGLIIALVVLAVIALIGFRVGPAYSEYFTAKSIIKTIATENRAGTVASIRKAWVGKTMIEEIKVISETDLEITKDGGEVVISFAYKKEVPLFANIGLYLDFAASSKE